MEDWPEPEDNPAISSPTRTQSVLMWSGGLDSTYALVRLLSETHDEVIAHHVHYLGGEPGSASGAPGSSRRERLTAFEAQAVTALLPRLRESYRDFSYSESRLDLSALAQTSSMLSVSLFVAAQVALDRGLTPFDRIVVGASAGSGFEWRPRTYAHAFRRLASTQLLQAVWESRAVPQIFVWQPAPTRLSERAALTDDLLERVAGCVHPQPLGGDLTAARYVPCGTCEYCALSARPQSPGQPGSGGRSGAAEQDIESAGAPVARLGAAEAAHFGAEPQPAVD